MLTDLRGLERRCPTRRGPRGLIRAGSETGAPIREDRLISVLRRSAFGFQMAWVVWLFGTGPAVRGAESPAPSDSVPAPLTSVQQVLALGARTAGQCFVPARLEGLITYADAAAQIIYVQDASGGIRVVYTNASHLPVSGQLVVV